jgi:hypothetical protein
MSSTILVGASGAFAEGTDANPAKSPSESAQHAQARAAASEEPKLWGDLVGMEFKGGAYPSDEQAARIFDEYDFQRATQGFIWSLPAMNMYSMREGSEKLFGKGNQSSPFGKAASAPPPR